MNKYVYLLISHESYKDVLDIHLNQFNKCVLETDLIICFNDKTYINNKYNGKYNVIEYDDKLPYMERIHYILNKIDYEYVILVHDTNIPIGNPSDNIFDRTLSFMVNNNVDQVRMFVSGISTPIFNDSFNKIPNNSYYFSVNVAIWKKASLSLISSLFRKHDYRCSECTDIQNFVKKMKNYYISSEKDIRLNGHGHVISYNFPFCHTMSHGRWTINPHCEQTNYIMMLLKEYNIDINIRGTN